MAFYGLGFAILVAIILYLIRNKEEKTLLIRYMATLLIIFGISIFVLPFLNS